MLEQMATEIFVVFSYVAADFTVGEIKRGKRALKRHRLLFIVIDTVADPTPVVGIRSVGVPSGLVQIRKTRIAQRAPWDHDQCIQHRNVSMPTPSRPP